MSQIARSLRLEKNNSGAVGRTQLLSPRCQCSLGEHSHKRTEVWDLFAAKMEQQSNRSHRPVKEKKKFEGMLTANLRILNLRPLLQAFMEEHLTNLIFLLNRFKPEGLYLLQNRKTQPSASPVPGSTSQLIRQCCYTVANLLCCVRSRKSVSMCPKWIACPRRLLRRWLRSLDPLV